jgi:hypothetical protein
MGTIAAVSAAWKLPNPLVAIARQLHDELDLASLDPEIFPPQRGRPGQLRWVLLADALAKEIATERLRRNRKWPLVASLLTPFLEIFTPSLLQTPEHIHRLVDHWKRELAKRHGEEPGAWTWDEHLRLLCLEAHLPVPPGPDRPNPPQ